MIRRHAALLDPAAGISGDMLLGALIDAGAPVAWLEHLPGRLGLEDVSIEVGRVLRGGVACARVTVRLPGGGTEGPSPTIDAPVPLGPGHHGHGSHLVDMGQGAHGHRHLPELLDIVRKAPLSPWVRDRAMRAFQLLGEEEGRVHGMPAEAVALHEVGAVDALIDIVGGIEGFEQLGVETVYVRPVALGEGWIRSAHGIVPVPAPVTVPLLQGLEIRPSGPVIGEATTPTGAVLLRVLSAGNPPSRWRPVRSAWGAGARDPEHYPNALRLLIVEPAAEVGQVVTLSSDVDDLSPEYIDPLREALVAAGALDVQVWTTQMKKGRPGFRIEAICDEAHANRVTEAFFVHSTTAGIRRAVAERVTLTRHRMEIDSAGTMVAVKILDTPSGPRVKAEFDDVRVAALKQGRAVLDVAREVEGIARARMAGVTIRPSSSSKEKE
ncbi:MAG TPA: nickel pincer cofactor biosynthesis protein LarC [Gemmatimonadales bacterium]|nr:nickel pincer cofactor biosynthesis protein LarC [Gemmatimonadales bacterium]